MVADGGAVGLASPVSTLAAQAVGVLIAARLDLAEEAVTGDALRIAASKKSLVVGALREQTKLRKTVCALVATSLVWAQAFCHVDPVLHAVARLDQRVQSFSPRLLPLLFLRSGSVGHSRFKRI